MAVQPLLCLYDIDGTLAIDGAGAHKQAMVRAMALTWGVSVGTWDMDRTRPWGKTDRCIVHEVMGSLGVGRESVDEGLASWEGATVGLFERYVQEGASVGHARAGAAQSLGRLQRAGLRQTLLTGNLRGVAHLKMRRLGLDASLDLDEGAYGDDAEDRLALGPVARARAKGRGAWPRERTVIIGDTPMDVAAARADCLRCVAFTSEQYGPADLDGATALVEDAQGMEAVLLGWAEG